MNFFLHPRFYLKILGPAYSGKITKGTAKYQLFQHLAGTLQKGSMPTWRLKWVRRNH
jgi:hypothetical protein